MEILYEVAERLKYYVYALRDPRDGQVFYVGKGKGARINSHVVEAGQDPTSERAKLRKIPDVETSGREVELLFLRTELEEATALTVEQAVIDAFRADGHPLTNLVKGHDSGRLGLAELPAVVARYGAEACPAIEHLVIMVKMQRGWRADMNRGIAVGAQRGACGFEGQFESEMT
jgi:hypothetical protein